LIPNAGEFSTVAPDIDQVREETEQLSAINALGTMTEALHKPVSLFLTITPGHVIVGATVSNFTPTTLLSIGVVHPVPVLVMITLL
jgi:hypothetical protein